jgi:hypothetical protein
VLLLDVYLIKLASADEKEFVDLTSLNAGKFSGADVI